MSAIDPIRYAQASTLERRAMKLCAAAGRDPNTDYYDFEAAALDAMQREVTANHAARTHNGR